MKNIRIITGVLTAALIAASLAGCGEKSETQDVSSMKQEQEQGQGQVQGHPGQGQEQKAPQEQRGTMAKVVSLEGDQLTLIPAEIPDRRSPASGPAIDGAGQSGDPEQPGEPGQGGGKIEFTGEEATYTLSDNVSIMKGFGDSAAEIDLSELKADDAIRFTMATDDNGNEVIDTITLME